MVDACTTRSSLFYTGHWLAELVEGSNPIAVMEVDTKTESWEDLVIISHSQRSISQSSMKDSPNKTAVIVFADLRALYEENNLIVRTRHHSINTFSIHLGICI